MTSRKPSNLEVEKFFEFARRREGRPALKPLNFTFEPARRPDMMLPERPRVDIRAADSAMREIREYAGKARELYRERRYNARPLEAREYVRYQLALGMLDAPSRWTDKPNSRPGKTEDRVHNELRSERAQFAEPPKLSLFSLLRRGMTRG
jgi:hypothetical protein